MKVLIVDEDLQVQVLFKVLNNMYTDDTFKIVYNLHDAKHTIWNEKFDILVIDIMLPSDEDAVPGSSQDGGVISGLQLIDLIKNDKNCINYKTPIVLLTGVPSVLHSRIKEAEETYCGKYFQKPIKPDALYIGLQNAVKEMKG